MRAFHIYLNFDGNTRDAMTFYKQALGAELEIQSFADVHMEMPGAENRTVHARLSKGNAIIMASDTMPGQPLTQGNNAHVSVDCETIEETDRFFAALSEGGTVTMPLDKTFWNAYFGMLTDKFGVNWMFNCELPKA